MPDTQHPTPVVRVIDELLERANQRTAWLRKAGPIARRLREESEHD